MLNKIKHFVIIVKIYMNLIFLCFGLVVLALQICLPNSPTNTFLWKQEPQIEAVVIDFLLGIPPSFYKTLESICQFPCVFYLSLPLPLPYPHGFKIIKPIYYLSKGYGSADKTKRV